MLVDQIFLSGFSVVRHGASDHQEQNNAHGKNVHSLAPVRPSFKNLRGLVHFSPDLRVVNAETVRAFAVG